MTYKLLTRKRGVDGGSSSDDVGARPIGSQTVKNIKVGPWMTLTAAIMVAICTAAVGGPLRYQWLPPASGGRRYDGGQQRPSECFILAQLLWPQQSVGLLIVVAASLYDWWPPMNIPAANL